jgi:hypothetical protein
LGKMVINLGFGFFMLVGVPEETRVRCDLKRSL